MQLAKWFLVVTCVSVGILPATAGEDVDRLVAALLGDTPLISDLQDLTDTVGGRPTGSEANRRAVAWALARFEAAGVTARRESFTMPSLWLERSAAAVISGKDVNFPAQAQFPRLRPARPMN